MRRGAFASRTIFRPEAEPRFPETAENTSTLPRASTSTSPSLSPLTAKEAPTSNNSSSFFRRLSPEIQDSILTFAFGNRIIHLELNAEDSQWHLRGFVCARSPALATEHQDAGPMNDLCLQHLAQIQSLAKPPPNFQDPGKGYQIGALGWLLSSKQAYMSGIRILYSKNKFYIADKDLSSRLPLFLPSYGLQHITKMEMSWALDWMKPPEHSEYHKQLELLPITLPHLQDLHVSFKCQLLTPVWLAQQPDQREAIERTLLPPLDAMVSKLESRCQVSVAFTPALWTAMMGRARRTRPNPNDLIVEWAPRPPARPCGHGDRFWRALPATVDAQDQTKDRERDENTLHANANVDTGCELARSSIVDSRVPPDEVPEEDVGGSGDLATCIACDFGLDGFQPLDRLLGQDKQTNNRELEKVVWAASTWRRVRRHSRW
ncbi:hypothetical protein HIM_09708 [Hirsutella minnesotensis 3608]|uniref:DUF7730 domain-containing protein n=1 Tax=Hirsutella minnesotensis 3608 TaxID=1043627 RepID=A0A0F7ZL37_9HYPO|nr:hypothetical protein HIM_09708 [Hirsutella minnesotensis 3608]